jgi:hypothetical protein
MTVLGPIFAIRSKKVAQPISPCIAWLTTPDRDSLAEPRSVVEGLSPVLCMPPAGCPSVLYDPHRLSTFLSDLTQQGIMKFETRITLTREELNKYVADGRKAEGKPLHDDEVLTIVLEDSAPAAPSAPPPPSKFPEAHAGFTHVDVPGSEPATIRYNNPGGMWDGPSAAKFGSSTYGVIGGGNHIAKFDTPEQTAFVATWK